MDLLLPTLLVPSPATILKSPSDALLRVFSGAADGSFPASHRAHLNSRIKGQLFEPLPKRRVSAYTGFVGGE